MKNFYMVCIASLLMIQCSSYKQAHKRISYGQYDQAIDKLITQKAKGVKEEDYAQWVELFQDAYLKANEYDNSRIKNLKQDVENAQKYKDIYHYYQQLQKRQEKVQAVLPIYLNDKKVHFPIEDYSHHLSMAKENYIHSLINEASILLNSKDKLSARQAYQLYDDVYVISPQYPNILNLKNQAYEQGLTHFLVRVNNYSSYYFPRDLEAIFTDTRFYTSDQNWNKFHFPNSQTQEIDYLMDINFTNVFMGPSLRDTNRETVTAQVADGWQYARDSNGEFILDSNGNKIKEDKFKTIEAEVIELQQFKEVRVKGNITLLKGNNRLQTIPFETHFVFEDFSATINGDRAAVDQEYLDKYERKPAPMPSNERMVADAGIQIRNELNFFLDDFLRKYR